MATTTFVQQLVADCCLIEQLLLQKRNRAKDIWNTTHNSLKVTSDRIFFTGLDWIVQCFTSPPTQYRLYGRRFLQVKRPNQQYQSTEGKIL